MLSKYFLVKTFTSILPYSLPGNLQAYQPEYLQWFLIISLSKHLSQYCHTSLPGNLQAYKPEYIHGQRVSLSEHLPVYCHKSLPGNLQDYQPECIQCFPTGSLSKRVSLYFLAMKPASLSTRIYAMLSNRLCQNSCPHTFLPGNLQAYQPDYIQCFPRISFVKLFASIQTYVLVRKLASLSTRIGTMLSKFLCQNICIYTVILFAR